MKSSLRLYTEKFGFEVAFNFEDFYAGIRAGNHTFHLKLVDEQDPSIAFVEEGGHLDLYFETDDVTAVAERLKENGVALVKDVHDTDWQPARSSSTTIRATHYISASHFRLLDRKLPHDRTQAGDLRPRPRDKILDRVDDDQSR